MPERVQTNASKPGTVGNPGECPKRFRPSAAMRTAVEVRRAVFAASLNQFGPPVSADRLLGDLLRHGISRKVASLFGEPPKGELYCMINRVESVLFRQAFRTAQVP
jgi:hypothetical protein